MRYLDQDWRVESKDYVCKLGYVRYHLKNNARTLCVVQTTHQYIFIAIDVPRAKVYETKLTDITGELKILGKRLFNTMMDKVTYLKFENGNGRH